MQSTAGAIGGTVQEQRPGQRATSPVRVCSSASHFVLPAVLLLLSEEPSYGYEMVKGFVRSASGTSTGPRCTARWRN